MNTPEETALRERLKAAIEGGLTIKAAAIETGSDERAVSSWLQGNDINGMAALVDTWCDQVDKELAESLPGLVQTPTYKKILTALQATRRAPEVVTIFGAPGSGKTSTIRDFVWDETGCREAALCYIEAEEGATMPRLLQSLTTAFFGHYDALWGRSEIPNRLADGLQSASGRQCPVIFVDEVQRLENRLIAGLAWFYNQRNISLVLCGNDGKHSDLHGGKNKELAALSDRAAYRLHLIGPSKDDVDAILAAWGIKGRSERAFMQKARERLNSLRPLLRILRTAAGFARMRKIAIDIHVLRAAANDFGYQFEM
ncbi:MAG: AAA family ATPase [Betaproteobacteria bacterium]|nr:AAA family ATPase [Betaproteobacteria bacterium]